MAILYYKLARKVWNFDFGGSYLCCHLITSLEFGVNGSLFISLSNSVLFVRMMHLWDEQHN